MMHFLGEHGNQFGNSCAIGLLVSICAPYYVVCDTEYENEPQCRIYVLRYNLLNAATHQNIEIGFLPAFDRGHLHLSS